MMLLTARCQTYLVWWEPQESLVGRHRFHRVPSAQHYGAPYRARESLLPRSSGLPRGSGRHAFSTPRESVAALDTLNLSYLFTSLKTS